MCGIATAVAAMAAIAPASALGATFTVNQTSDEFDAGSLRDGSCDTDTSTSGNQCTLRAATQEASDSTVNPGTDTIDFDPGVFTGSAATSTITATSPQPGLGDATLVNGGDCDPGAGFKPCVGFQASGGNLGLIVAGDNVEVRGLAITNGAIGVTIGGDNAKLAGNWIGLRLDETPQGNGKGVQLTGDANTVGGQTAADRNVFAHNTEDGLQISGGDNNVVRGNYFGTKPDGTTPAPPTVLSGTRDNIEIASPGGLANLATGNTIGGTADATQLASPECDGPCNVIANSKDGIDLETEGGAGEAAAGATAIKGNFIGLDKSGQAQAANTNVGIRAGLSNATNNSLTVGGPAAGDRNVIAGNVQSGIVADSGATVRNNYFGSNSQGDAAIPNTFGDLRVGTNTAVPNSTVQDNRFVGSGSFGGRLSLNGGTEVVGNTFGIGTGGETLGSPTSPILVLENFNEIGGPDPGDANTVGNVGNGEPAVHVMGGNENRLRGNLIGVTAGGTAVPNSGPGIRITNSLSNTALDNTIGGDTQAEENVISNTAGDAIEIVDDQSAVPTADNDGNTIAQNRGSNNGTTASDLFIDLRTDTAGDGLGNPADGPNGHIQALAPGTATNTALSGIGAASGVMLRAFKTFTARGDVRGFVGSSPDDGGAWSVSYTAPLPDGQCVTATQTDAGGNTSELPNAVPIDAAVCDVTGPTASVDDGPSGATSDPTPAFAFSSNEPGSTFECRVDSAAFAACSGPGDAHTTDSLADGPHTFEVRATDAVGNTGPPASRAFTVDTSPGPGPPPPGPDPGTGSGGGDIADTAPPDTTITAGPKAKTKKKTATITFTGTDARDVASFECKLDAGSFEPCTSPKAYSGLKKGKHTVAVRAVDAAGNVDPTPATRSWKVKKRKRKK
jgi:hypothetical protein